MSNAQTLDAQLLRLVDTKKKWDLFNDQYLQSLEPSQETDQCLVRKGFPRADPTDSDPQAYSVDRLDLGTMDVGRTTHMQMIAIAYHSAMLDEWSGPSTRINSEFDRNRAVRSLYSLCAPLAGTTNAQLSCEGWFSGLTYDTLRGIDDHRVLVPREKLAPWKASGDVKIESETEEWARTFSPLQHFRWIVPDSQVHTWDVALDRNTVYTMGWYQYYLQRMSAHETATTDYATATRRNEVLKKQLVNLSERFLQKNSSMREEFRITQLEQTREDINRQNVGQRTINKFVRSLEKLYNDFTHISLPAVRRGQPKSRQLVQSGGGRGGSNQGSTFGSTNRGQTVL